MPGEQAVLEAVRDMSGVEAAVIAFLALCAVGAIVGLFIHLRDCRAATERLHQRISDSAAEQRAEAKAIEEKIDTIIPLVHRIDERTQRE